VARQEIRRRHCRVGAVHYRKTRRSLLGRVIRQNPLGRAIRPRNFRIRLTVGKR
jgi:hypothetical protein